MWENGKKGGQNVLIMSKWLFSMILLSRPAFDCYNLSSPLTKL